MFVDEMKSYLEEWRPEDVREIDPLLTRPVGHPPNRPIVWSHDFLYQAGSWSRPRRVIAKVEWHAGELFPRVGFIVTNLRRPEKKVVKFYNGRGTAEQWIKEGKYALNWTRLSCTGLPPTRYGSSYLSWPTIWATSCAGYAYRRQSTTGHCAVSK